MDKAIINAKKSLKLYTNATISCITIPLVLLMIFYPYLNLVYTTEYVNTFQIFVFIALALYISPLYNQGNIFITLVKKTALLPLASGIAAVTNIVFNLILIKKYGIEGAAMATLLANVSLIWIINLSTKHKPNNLVFILLVSVLVLTYLVLYMVLNSSFHYILIMAIFIFSIFNMISEFKNIKLAKLK